jgi:hypothetical protein
MYAGGGTSASGAMGSTYIMSGATASYNGMVVSLEHRVSSNFVLLANYTWSHCIDITDNTADVSTVTIQNPANIKGDKGSCGFDFRHMLNTAVVASSHFALTGWKGQVIDHWEISPLVHVTDGNPFMVTSGYDNSLTDVGNDRPNLTNPSVLYTHAKIQKAAAGKYTSYISSSAFTQNTSGTFGTSGRYAYRGPKFLQADAALSRSFSLRDSFAMNLRLESFNLLNHPDFAAPGSATGSGGYLGTSSALSSGTFGTITSTMNNYGARVFQGALKITF